MDVSQILQEYGYAAIFIGACAEGESMLLLGGYAAHRGYLELPWVILTAFAAAVAGDQAYFYLGRHYGARILSRRPAMQRKVSVALRLAERHSTLVVLGMRFLWGFRIAMPLAIGMSTLPARRYLLLNLFAAAAWSVIFGTLGYAGSYWLSAVIGDLHQHEAWIIAALLLSALSMLAGRWLPRQQPTNS